MKDYGKAVRDKLHAAGWRLHRQGKHEIWAKGDQRIAVPRKLLIRHTANAILKSAGLPKEF